VNQYIFLGLAIMIVSEAATVAGIEPFASWNTPIAWTGFIIFADAVVYRARGNSWMRSSPREFAALCLVSIPLWLVFESFNLVLRNWHYVGLPENVVLRTVGYAWSFATIWPAIFEASELISVWRTGQERLRPRWGWAPTAAAAVGTPGWGPSASAKKTGRAFPSWLRPPDDRRTDAGVAISRRARSRTLSGRSGVARLRAAARPHQRVRGEESLQRDWRAGQFNRTTNLVLSGFLCGGLWELWNYWAHAKWHYTVPIMENLKVFEMPLPGYLGFPPFALECFTMYVFLRSLIGRSGRPIAL
jgi:hypothetical protein